MKVKFSILASLFLLGFSSSTLAVNPGFANLSASEEKLLAAPGSTQFVVVMNNLHNPAAPDHTKSDITVKYYDGTGNHPPCWTENKIGYRSDPNIAGAGGKNDCGKPNTNPSAIVKIDIIPLKTGVGKLYEDLTEVSIDPKKFYISLLVEQDKEPTYYPNGSLKTLGTLKVRKFADNE